MNADWSVTAEAYQHPGVKTVHLLGVVGVKLIVTSTGEADELPFKRRCICPLESLW